ncbi:DUF305 domain-containing protein [Amycolatopsis sp. SID8362]|uniref:DUF305 domain-containing protein n=1 Tax=Amycolatopsis sp. SID8362 TaxID=2690346 RepID=UPI001367E908|nr:DUF305 domain-containing protein [Amycolatopsis sp. SID8362]NBH03451.1 DUF305 domain-containing protein [Amycolatopsis sp. SID8362]NED40151.1 DUF305 domain-containing protein [Amycolatopsis sp. SID8362]
MRKTLLVSGVALVSALVLSACSSSDHASMPGMSSSPSAPAASPSQQAGDHNADDIAFAQQMVPHHSQALDMAKLVPSRSTNPKVIDLASRIEKAQDPEIQQMQGWLTTWGAPSTSSMPSMPGMDHGSMGSMPGMMSDADMQKLEQAKGAEFDKMWLDMMIKHHQGAVEMAKTELSKGSNADAKALAQKIIDAQQAEITEMQGLLSQS